ncbi:MAG: ABC transporter permease [Solobacterium sp.]|nr:ABC transporter permease [Solobacterium sp.]MBQ1321294.1 ABC transporter permease [Solobacterium sp.]MBQ1356148.1 ABC transporter permease [Solobacterium sp.]
MKSFSKMVYPYIVWAFVMIVLPMVMIVLYAFTVKGNSVLTFQFTLDNFARFFRDTIFPTVLWRSLKMAFITTGLCILIGYPTAYIFAKMKPNNQAIMILLVTLPMWINVLVRTYAWRGLLGYVDLSTEMRVYVGMIYNFMPFMILEIYTSLSKIDPNLIVASHDLGANDAETFRRVILPLSLPGVVSGITLVFLPAVSSFFIPKFLGGGQYVLIGNLIEDYFITSGDWNFGSAISLIMAIIILISMYVMRKLDHENKEVLD